MSEQERLTAKRFENIEILKVPDGYEDCYCNTCSRSLVAGSDYVALSFYHYDKHITVDLCGECAEFAGNFGKIIVSRT